MKGSLEGRGLPGRRVWRAFCRFHPSSPTPLPRGLDAQRNPRSDAVSPSEASVCRKQLQPISLCVKLVENVEEMGNLEGTVELLKEKCRVLLLKKNLLKKKITVPNSLHL